MAVDAVASEHGEALAEAVRRAFPVRRSAPYHTHGQQHDCDALLRLIQLAVYANDAAGFTASRDLHDKECAPHRAADLLTLLFSATPLAADWLASRHPAIQLALLESGVPGPDLPALIAHYRAQQGRDGFGAVRGVLLPYDLLANRLDDVWQGAAAIEDAGLRPGAPDRPGAARDDLPAGHAGQHRGAHSAPAPARQETGRSWMGFAHLAATMTNLRVAECSHRP